VAAAVVVVDLALERRGVEVAEVAGG